MNPLVAAVQMQAGKDKAQNLEAAARLIATAAGHGAQLVVLPETFDWRGSRAGQVEAAEDLAGPTLQLMAELARRHRIFLVAGSITERIPGDSHAYNTSVLLGPDGVQLAYYRKIHLFDVEMPGRVVIRESDAKRAGTQTVCAATALGTIGLSVCYDLRFPELYRQLATLGASIITIPSCFTYPTGEAHWEVLVRARAIENQAFVVAPGQFGRNVYGYNEYGNSMLVDPWGRVLTRASSDQEEVIVARCDFAELDRVRNELPALKHRRL
jgi:predicted amidohydrolase